MPADMFRTPPSPPVNNSPAGEPVRVEGRPIQSNPPVSEAQQRWLDMQRSGDAEAGRYDQTKFMTVKNPDGTLVVKTRADGGATGTPGSGDQPATPGDPQRRIDPVRTEDGKIVLGDGLEFTDQQLRDLVAFKTAEDARKLTAPAAADFRLELPPELKLPPGIEFNLDPNSPILPAAREFAHRNGFSQRQFSELVGLYAASTVGEQHQLATARAAEVQKLGAAAPARIDAVTTWLRAVGGEDFGRLAKVLTIAPVAGTIEGFERLMHKFSSQGGGSYSGAHREPNQPERLSSEAYNKLTYTEKKAYAEEASAREQAIRR
jgi:hypothetical protein